MLETIREYAAERLEERARAGRAAPPPRRPLPRAAEAAAVGAPSTHPAWVRDELDNIRRARGWLIASGDVERDARLAVAAMHTLWKRANLRELKAWVLSALERSADLDPGLRADALGAAALAATLLAESEVAREYARKSLEIARERNDKRQIEWALRLLSFDEPDLDERRRLLHECEALLRELGNDEGLGWVTLQLGMPLFEEGRFNEARETFNRAVAIFTGLGKRWEAANAETAIAYALIADGQHEAARPILEQTLRIAVDLQSMMLAIEALTALGCVRVQTDPGAAARLLSAAEAIAKESGQRLETDYASAMSPIVEGAAEAARKRLGDEFGVEWEAGSELTLNEAVALAVDEE